MSIPHLQDLPLDEFISAVSNISAFQITEKLDGANLIIGIDLSGKFYTSREGKSGERCYACSDWPDTAAGVTFRNAHVFLHNQPLIFKSIEPGNAYECEVLFGRQPNAITYGENMVVFLRPVVGDSGILSPPVDTMSKTLMDISNISVPTTMYQSIYGYTINTSNEQQLWSVKIVPRVDVELFANVDVWPLVSTMIDWLSNRHTFSFGLLTNGELLHAKLNKYSVSSRSEIKEARLIARENVLIHKAAIAEKYIDVLKNTESQLRTVDIDNSTSVNCLGIEGVVFLNTETQSQFKLVNRKEFTAINCFNHAVRNATRKMSYATMPSNVHVSSELRELEMRDSLYDQFLQAFHQEHNIPGLDFGMSLKRTIRKMSGDSMDDTLSALESAWKDDRHITAIRYDVGVICVNSIHAIEAAISQYFDDARLYRLYLDDVRWIEYTQEIHNRTLLCFAELYQELTHLCVSTTSATSKREILEQVFKKQLCSIH